MVLIVAASFLLTACDPPMPPEVKAALAEQSYTCVAGETKLAAIEPIAAVAGDWQASVSTNCEGMQITPVDSAETDTELEIGALPNSACKAYLDVPYATDAIVFAVMLTDITEVNLSAEAIEKIWSKQITTWNDPLLAKLNPGFEMPSVPISFGAEISASSAAPLSDWLQRKLGRSLDITATSASLDSLSEGGLVVTTYSAAMNLGAQLASVEGVLPEVGSINSGASMFTSKVASGKIVLSFDAKAKPIAPEGVATAPKPYQALYFIDLKLCGTDSLKTRAAARYLLRQDSQGSLGLSAVVGLPENLRLISLTEVSKGLPEPVVTAPAN